jgi:ABC-type lipoprotein release transport system permease subunit
MGMIWIIAWKNIWRNRMRSIVVLMSVAFGLLGGVFSAAVLKGTSDQRVREAVSRETSHLQIHHQSYSEDNEVKYVINGDRQKLDLVLDTLSAIEAWSPRIKFMAMAASANAGGGVMVKGIDPDRERMVSDIHSLINDTNGTWFGGGKGVPVVVGSALAKKLKVKLHSKIVLTFQDMQGNLTGGAFRIVGIYRTSNSVFDEMNIFVNRNDIVPLMAADSNICHEIAVKMSNDKLVDPTQQTLKGLFPHLLIQSWKEVDPLLGMMDGLLNLWLYLFMSIIMLALGFGIVNTMLMAILERTRELGMLAAIGMNKQRIFFMIMLESVFLSLTGGVLGIIVSTILIAWTNHTGINLGSFTEGFEKMGYNPMLYPSLDPVFFINLTLMVISTGILAAIYPARRALKLHPAEAIRNE